MSGVERAADAILEEHRRLGSPLSDFLRPGRSRSDVRTTLQQLVPEAPEGLVDLYAWRDGTDLPRYLETGPPFGDLLFVPPVRFESLDEAIELARLGAELARWLAATIGPPARPDEFWSSGWLPILVAGPDYLVVDAASRGQVWTVRWEPVEGDPNRVLYGSVDEMLEDFVERFRAGAFYWDPEAGRLFEAEPALGRFASLGL